MTDAPQQHQSLKADFHSPWWLPDRHSQTLWRRFSPPVPILQRRERMELADGDFIDLDWVDPAPVATRGERPLVFLLHGLCGSSRSPYIQSLQRLLQSRGYPSVAMNFRGCSGEFNRLARAYHSGCTEDVEEVYQILRQRLHDRPFAFAGFSLGGNVLLKWLSQIGQRQGLVSAVAVSTPFALAYCSEALNTGLSKAYGHYFRRRLVSDVQTKRAYFCEHQPHRRWREEVEKLDALGDLRRLQTLWEFDDQVTAPLHGFAGAKDYYDRCSSGQVLDRIHVPVHLIQSSNDPIIPVQSLPSRESLPPGISLHLTTAGGHVGFTCRDDAFWLEERIVAAIGQALI